MTIDWTHYDTAPAAVLLYRKLALGRCDHSFFLSLSVTWAPMDSDHHHSDNINTIFRSGVVDAKFTPSYPSTITTFVDEKGSYRAIPHVPIDGYTCVPVMFPQLTETFETHLSSRAEAMWALLQASEEKVKEVVHLPETEAVVLNPGGRTLKGVLGVVADRPAARRATTSAPETERPKESKLDIPENVPEGAGAVVEGLQESFRSVCICGLF
jgi:hypothetical protein